MDINKDLMELCETLSRSISTANEKIRSAGGKLSQGDVDFIQKLVHSLKSIKSVMRMEEEAQMMDDDYSERGGYSRAGGSYGRGGGSYRVGSYRGSYEGGSYGPGRGRGSNARRDSMGRYSSRDDSYSRGEDMVNELRELAENAPNDQIKQELMRVIDKM